MNLLGATFKLKNTLYEACKIAPTYPQTYDNQLLNCFIYSVILFFFFKFNFITILNDGKKGRVAKLMDELIRKDQNLFGD